MINYVTKVLCWQHWSHVQPFKTHVNARFETSAAKYFEVFVLLQKLLGVGWYLVSDVSGQHIVKFKVCLELLEDAIGWPETSVTNYQSTLRKTTDHEHLTSVGYTAPSTSWSWVLLRNNTLHQNSLNFFLSRFSGLLVRQVVTSYNGCFYNVFWNFYRLINVTTLWPALTLASRVRNLVLYANSSVLRYYSCITY